MIPAALQNELLGSCVYLVWSHTSLGQSKCKLFAENCESLQLALEENEYKLIDTQLQASTDEMKVYVTNKQQETLHTIRNYSVLTLDRIQRSSLSVQGLFTDCR